jgi:hypothetical protein
MSDYRQALEQLAAMLRMSSQLVGRPELESGKETAFRTLCGQYAVSVQQQIDLVAALEGRGTNAK